MVLILHEYYSYCNEELGHQIYGCIESKVLLHILLIGYVWFMKINIYEVITNVMILSIILIQ
jgi:hypothetical protein